MSPMELSTMEMIMSTTTLNIPNDIVIDILIRVPAKSLLRLRWAYKCWFHLITRDPDFIKLHLHTATSSTLISNVISVQEGITDLLQCFSVNCYNNSNTESSLEITDFTSIQSKFRFSQEAGYCNGLLVCTSLTFVDRICIWNPCTQEYKLLPDLPLLIGDDGRKLNYYCMYGIGYDRTIDDYKVIRNAYYCGPLYKNVIALNTLVYTLETDSWRNIEPCPYRLHSSYEVFVNGALYNWISDYPEIKIISFDMAKEKYKEMSKLPSWSTTGNYCVRSLHVFEGCLCVVLSIRCTTESETHCMEMWVMKNDNGMNNSEEEEESWTVLFKFQNPIYFNHFIIKPVRFTKNREIIMLLRKKLKLVLCDPKSNTIRTVGSMGKKENHISQLVVYIESLVSLNSGTYYKLGKNETKTE